MKKKDYVVIVVIIVVIIGVGVGVGVVVNVAVHKIGVIGVWVGGSMFSRSLRILYYREKLVKVYNNFSLSIFWSSWVSWEV